MRRFSQPTGPGPRLRRIPLGPLVALLSVLVAAALTFAQGTRGTISGRVTDPAGAVIPAATVKLVDVAKQQEIRAVQTNGEGVYQFLEVEPAVYDVVISAAGFSEARLKEVKVEPNRNVQLDAALRVGSAIEEVNITGTQELVDRESPTIGTTVDPRRVVGLPLNGRNVLTLALLQPGVIPVGALAGQTTDPFGAGLRLRVHGNRGVENNLTLDGSNNNEVAVGGALGATPRPDAVQEFRLLTSNYEAEFGRNTGSVINVVTRSGASDFHGNLRFFYRPTFLSAARFFDKALPGTRPPADDFRRRFERKEFGGNLGGPFLLPKKVFGPLGTDSKNRAFFFFDYEGRRQLLGDTRTITNLPTAAERAGDFSALLPGRVLRDPATGQPFLNNRIPPERFANSPIVNYYLRFLPVGDASGTARAGANQITDNDWITGRGDFFVTDKQTVNFIFNYFDSVVDEPFAFGGASVPGFGANELTTTYNVVARHTYALTPAVINSLLLGYGRNNFPSVFPQNRATPAEIGFARSDFVANPLFVGPPVIRLFDRGDLRIGNSVQGPQARLTENFQIQDAVSWATGDHRFKFGFDGTHYRQQQAFTFINNGGFVFSRRFGANTSGDDFADFLLGNPVFYQFGNTGDRDFRQNAVAAFGQDTWRVTPALTLSLGLRWEYTSPLRDKFNRVAYYRPGAVSQLLSSGQLRDFEGRPLLVPPGGRAPVGLVYVGDPDPVLGGQVPSGGVAKDLNNFAPRIGLAYNPRVSGGWLRTLLGENQTVIRAGYGIYYGAIIGDNILQQLGAPGFSSVVTQVFGFGAGTLADPFAPDPFPNFNGNGTPLQNPITAPRTIGAPLIAFPFAIDPRIRTPYNTNYNLTIERGFGQNYVLSLGYVGQRGRKLYAAEELNPGLGTFFPFPPGRTAPAGGVTSENVNLRRLNDDIRASISQTVSAANSWYNAFEAQVQKRYSNGLLFQVAYTFSKAITDADTQRGVLDLIDRRFGRGLSNDDVPHRLVISWIYDLPFGRNLGGATRWLLGGWSLGGIATFQSGTPVTVFNNFDEAGTGGIITFADLGAPFTRPDPRAGDRPRAFNADAFRSFCNPATNPLATCFRRGTAGRNMFRLGNGANNFDLILSKKTRLWNETAGLELRFEAFNAFNHTQFTTVNTNLNNVVRDASGAIDLSQTGFGRFTNARESRVIQLGARFTF